MHFYVTSICVYHSLYWFYEKRFYRTVKWDFILLLRCTIYFLLAIVWFVYFFKAMSSFWKYRKGGWEKRGRGGGLNPKLLQRHRPIKRKLKRNFFFSFLNTTWLWSWTCVNEIWPLFNNKQEVKFLRRKLNKGQYL